MHDLLERLAVCIEKGKADENSAYPPEMRGEPGASELTKKALDSGINPNEILSKSLMTGMNRIGEKFEQGTAFIPNLLISAKAMNAAMVHLKPFFDSGEAKHKGVFVLGTVKGDLHDIGKNIVKMILEGDGWKTVDLGIDADAEKFTKAVSENPDCYVGLSALLTTTMMNMQEIVRGIKKVNPETKIFIGGAPVSTEFNNKIGADGYFKDPQVLVRHLKGEKN